MEAEAVARIGYRALMAGKQAVIAGWVNKMAVAFMSLVPARWLGRVAAKFNRSPGD
jgi:short-subunit dehydrogenase